MYVEIVILVLVLNHDKLSFLVAFKSPVIGCLLIQMSGSLKALISYPPRRLAAELHWLVVNLVCCDSHEQKKSKSVFRTPGG